MSSINLAEWEQAIRDSTPGRFEGENPATAYYWDAWLNGDGEECAYLGTKGWVRFATTEEEQRVFGVGPWYLICQDDQGFIWGVDA